jgi:hypothetical protein
VIFPEEPTNPENFLPCECSMMALKLCCRKFAQIENLLNASDVLMPFFAKTQIVKFVSTTK